MIITAVDDQQDLFLIEDILPIELINQIQQEQFWEYPWEKQEMQLDWARRKLISNGTLLEKIDIEYNRLLDQIAQATNIEFTNKFCWSAFWLDYKGYTCDIHEDGAERNYSPLMAMQIYLTESDDELGTVWYKDSQGTTIRYQFPYKINTGYLMLNRPGQWHGMLNQVPKDHLRLSSYTYFGQFNHK